MFFVFGPVSNSAQATDVLVTGIGLVTPLGLSRQETWENLLAGKRAGRTLETADIGHFEQLASLIKREPIAAPVLHEDVHKSLQFAERIFKSAALSQEFAQSWGMDCLNNMVAFCLDDALGDSGLELPQLAHDRTGCVIGTSKPSLRSMEIWRRQSWDVGSEYCKPDQPWTSGFMPDSPLRTIQHLTGAKGPGSCPVAACATGLFSVIEGAALIASGQCDVCIVGSADASVRASVLAAFHRLGVTSKHDDPQSACRPFDVDRDGFVIGEGAGLAILESRAHAEARQANFYCQLADGISLTDPTGMTQIDSTGGTVSALLQRLQCDRPDFISVHGTGTESNDQAEARGISTTYSANTNGCLPCFGIKGALGHMLGAAASVEFGLTCLSMKHSQIPPTANFQNADAACPILLPSSTSGTRLKKAESAIKLSLGFGGHVVGCVVRAND